MHSVVKSATATGPAGDFERRDLLHERVRLLRTRMEAVSQAAAQGAGAAGSVAGLDWAAEGRPLGDLLKSNLTPTELETARSEAAKVRGKLDAIQAEHASRTAPLKAKQQELETRMSGLQTRREQLARELGTDLERGLSPQAAAVALAQHGFNELERTKRTPLLVLFLQQFASLIIIMLLIAAAIS
ncbi:MAG: cation-transporting P-type ATPase, partial [Hydrogenophaga sp.]